LKRVAANIGLPQTADVHGLSSLVILIIFCNLAEVNQSSAKQTNGILTPPVCGKPEALVATVKRHPTNGQRKGTQLH
jgi:hypothetical protein